MTTATNLFGDIRNLKTGEVIRAANSVDWDFAQENGEPQTGAFVDYETGETVFCDGPAEMTADMARAAFVERFEDVGAAMAFEEQVLGAGREFIPEALRGEVGTSEAYWAWLTDQHAEWQHVLPVLEGSRLLAEVERAYEAAKDTWTGRSWHDGDKVTPESTDEQIAELLTRGDDLAITCWGVDESDEGYRRRTRAAVEAINLLWQHGEVDGEAFSVACDVLRQLAEESDAGVAAQAKLAETSAAEAIKAARAGLKQTALSHADHAAAIERSFGDAPTWGHFAEAVRAWSEHEVE